MKSYIKFLGRNKLYTIIEAAGLAISLAFVILTGSYVWQQYGIARQNPDRDRIFLYGSDKYLGLSWRDKADIEGAIPEAELVTRYMIDQDNPVKVGDITFMVNTASVDKEFFGMFPMFRFLDGTPDAMDDLSNVLVTSTFANKIAAEGKNPIGQTILYEGEKTYTIAGIVEDFGRCIFDNPDIIFNVNETAADFGLLGHNVIGNVYTFMKVRPGTDIETLREKCADLMKKSYDVNSGTGYNSRLVNLEDLYFEPDSYMTRNVSLSMLRILLAVVIALLLSAIFNYINLSSALAGKRAKEMATRRLIGESKQKIFLSNILESVCFTAVCLVFALLIAELFEPVMNALLRGEDTMNPIELSFKPLTLLVYAAVAVILGAFVGFIPSIQAMRYQPIDVIKGTWRRRSKMVFSKVFIVIQNTISVVLVAIALLMEIQLGHMIDRPVNADTDNLFYLMSGMSYSHFLPVEDKLAALPCVEKIGHSSGIPGHLNMAFTTRSMFDDKDEKLEIRVMFCDTVAFNMLNFHKIDNYNHPAQGSLWLSESTANRLNLCDSTEAMILHHIGNVNMSGCEYIGGTYCDIPAETASVAKTAPHSAVYVIEPSKIITNSSLLIKTIDESAATKEAIMNCYNESTEEVFGMPLHTYISDFINDSLRKDLKPAEDTIRLVEIFMFLALLLSLLGLIAMSTYYAGQNTKDIAIRKVFGSTMCLETLRNVRGYMIMVLIACVIAVPISVVIGERYLQNFAYKVEHWWWMIALAVLLSLAISLASVLWQTVRAAQTNPATELKKE